MPRLDNYWYKFTLCSGDFPVYQGLQEIKLLHRSGPFAF